MYTYGLILVIDGEKDVYIEASKKAGRYGDHNVSSYINYESDPKLFEDTVSNLIKMYNGLREASEKLIKNFENKVSKDDFLLNQLRENLKRYENGKYAYPEEWKLVYHNGNDFEHIDDYKYFEEIKNKADFKKLYLFLIDIP